MQHVLFVCTGNIFRSMSAEYALRAELGPRSAIRVSSAGTDDYPHLVWPLVRDYLFTKGLDVREHRRRTLTETILSDCTLVIAMSSDHQRFLQERFSRETPLFTEACGGIAEPLLDVGEAIPDYESNPAAVQAHVRRIIDQIVELTPRLARVLQSGRNLQTAQR